MYNKNSSFWSGSTILTVRKGKQVVMAGDGQVTKSGLILNSHVKSVRRIGHGDVICGFTGTTRNAILLFDKLESIVTQTPHQLVRACVDLSKFWCQVPDLYCANTVMVVVNPVHSLFLTAEGDVLERDDGIIGVGSGGPYALAAARTLYDIEEFSAQQIVERSMGIAADICIYTNRNITFESIDF